MKLLRNLSLAILAAWAILLASAPALGNGGPFVVKYPSGDPAAKGVLARLDETLKPQRERDLKVLKEDLTITLDRAEFGGKVLLPLTNVVAEYTIQNPTDRDIEIDFGFPIIRGIYLNPAAMVPRPEVRVKLGGSGDVATTVISNSVIYGVIRARAREIIDKGIAEDTELAGLIWPSGAGQAQPAQQAMAAEIDSPLGGEELMTYLIERKKWSKRDAALMVAYASLDFGRPVSAPARWDHLLGDASMNEVANENLGPLAAIGEQKATQFFAQLARRFDAEAAAEYQSIFEAWGGDVREHSVDLATGEVRPREMTLSKLGNQASLLAAVDPTIYARIEYLNEKAKLTDQQKALCKAVLKNLDVTFTFAPMNLLYYRASFPAGKTLKVTVSYKQYAFMDTKDPASYQLAYVVHPASLWDSFGPINLTVRVPAGVKFRASVPCRKGTPAAPNMAKKKLDFYRTVLKSKEGEILLAVDKDSWERALAVLAKAK
ncbi:MAG: hypothetical protein ACYTF6_04710 [Planctomycetota bacterium]|jgi:hypothetical protein